MADSDSMLPCDAGALLQRYDPDSRLDSYYDALMVENEKVNLVSRETNRESFDRMVVECLLPLDSLCDTSTSKLPLFENYLDIGSGGGLPLVPLLLSKVIRHATAVERTIKKATALGNILNRLKLNARVISRTFEETKLATQFELVTMRYIKLTPALLSLIMKSLSEEGKFIYYSEPDFKPSDAHVVTHQFSHLSGSPVKHFSIISHK
ncbi:MAG: RsmG family class I SAM-dependent methyltransferase [candidate division Zixibacteria bacterium]